MQGLVGIVGFMFTKDRAPEDATEGHRVLLDSGDYLAS